MARTMELAARWGAVVVAAALGGCFSSRAPLVPEGESLKLFGEGGAAKRVSYPAMGGGPMAEPIQFVWDGGGYRVTDGRGRREPMHYRLAPLKGDWLIAQRTEPGGVDYGLARRIGDQLYVYAPQCVDLSDADRAALGLRLNPEGTCLMGSMTQLRATLTLVAARHPQPEGYYELAVRP